MGAKLRLRKQTELHFLIELGVRIPNLGSIHPIPVFAPNSI